MHVKPDGLVPTATVGTAYADGFFGCADGGRRHLDCVL
jgi:hypothetical protein